MKRVCDVCGKEVENPSDDAVFAGEYGGENAKRIYVLCNNCGRKWFKEYYLPSHISSRFKGKRFEKEWWKLFNKFLKENAKVKLVFT